MFLIDQNLSRRLAGLLSPRFPGSSHVVTEGLDRADDLVLWDLARTRGLVLLTKDRDFEALAIAHGPPPKVIVVAIGNCTTDAVASLVLQHADAIDDFISSDAALLILA